MGRRRRSLLDLRKEHEAAEARGLLPAEEPKKPRVAGYGRPAPVALPGTKVVWSVCDQGGRVTARFPYPEKAAAEAHAEALRQEGRGKHFVRAEKVGLTEA